MRNRDRARREKIMTYKRDIQRTEHELANPPEIEDMSIIEADIVNPFSLNRIFLL